MGLDLAGVNTGRERDRAFECAKRSFDKPVALGLFVPLRFLFPADRQPAVGHIDLDILFIHPGKLGGDFDQTITFLDFQTRPDLLHSDRTAETCAAETVEKTVDFTLQE
ncbi:hypothetical protein HY26_17790 [Hyphomonas sp. GM-8P]|nr:hypothetical protein HY26_17790 [Hyphomonas sp. GM-8P]